MTGWICGMCGHNNVHWPTCDAVDQFFDAEIERIRELKKVLFLACGVLGDDELELLMWRLREAGLVPRPTIKVIDPGSVIGSTMARVELGPEDRSKIPAGVMPE